MEYREQGEQGTGYRVTGTQGWGTGCFSSATFLGSGSGSGSGKGGTGTGGSGSGTGRALEIVEVEQAGR